MTTWRFEMMFSVTNPFTLKDSTSDVQSCTDDVPLILISPLLGVASKDHWPVNVEKIRNAVSSTFIVFVFLIVPLS